MRSMTVENRTYIGFCRMLDPQKADWIAIALNTGEFELFEIDGLSYLPAFEAFLSLEYESQRLVGVYCRILGTLAPLCQGGAAEAEYRKDIERIVQTERKHHEN